MGGLCFSSTDNEEEPQAKERSQDEEVFESDEEKELNDGPLIPSNIHLLFDDEKSKEINRLSREILELSFSKKSKIEEIDLIKKEKESNESILSSRIKSLQLRNRDLEKENEDLKIRLNL